MVGITDAGEYVFYDVVDMQPISFQTIEEPSTTAAGTGAISDIQENSSTDSRRSGGENVNTKNSLKGTDHTRAGIESRQSGETRDLSLPAVEPKETTPRDLSLPAVETQAEDDARADREAEAETEAAERRNTWAERAGKQMERDTDTRKAPRSTESLKAKLRDAFSIQGTARNIMQANELIESFAEDAMREGRISDKRLGQLFDALIERGSVFQAADSYFSEFRKAVKGTGIYVDPSTRVDFGEDWADTLDPFEPVYKKQSGKLKNWADIRHRRRKKLCLARGQVGVSWAFAGRLLLEIRINYRVLFS